MNADQEQAIMAVAQGLETTARGLRALAKDGSIPGPPHRRSLPSYVEEVLKGGRELHVTKLAQEVRKLGFKHAHRPKDPHQLEKSLAALVSRDSRFEKVPGRTAVYRLG